MAGFWGVVESSGGLAHRLRCVDGALAGGAFSDLDWCEVAESVRNIGVVVRAAMGCESDCGLPASTSVRIDGLRSACVQPRGRVEECVASEGGGASGDAGFDVGDGIPCVGVDLDGWSGGCDHACQERSGIVRRGRSCVPVFESPLQQCRWISDLAAAHPAWCWIGSGSEQITCRDGTKR